jgi:hypothetical protein
MNGTTRTSYDRRPPTQRPDPILEELRAMREEMARFRRLFNEWAGADLNGRFPYGKATDQWGDGDGERFRHRVGAQ